MALTAKQKFEHFGRMISHGLTNLLGSESADSFTLQDLVVWAKDYRINGTEGTQAQRKEAMKAAIRQLYQRTTGNDPDTQDHNFRSHWIEDASPGEGGEYS